MYEYGNARVRAMRGRLLGRRALEALVARYDVEQMLAGLGPTPYGPDVAAAQAGHRGAEAVEEAVRLNLARTTRALLSYYDGEARHLVALLIGHYDLASLIAVVRGRSAGASPEEIGSALLPGGLLPETALPELAEQPGVREVADVLATWRHPDARALSGALPEHERTGDPAPLERALVKSFYARTLASLRGRGSNVALVRRVLGEEIDVLNLTTVLRICPAHDVVRDGRVRDLLVDGGSLFDVRRLASLGALATPAEVLEAVAGSPYATALDGAAEELLETGRLGPIQTALERLLARRAVALARGDPLGIGVVIAYLAGRAAETANLRLIARGIELRLDKQAIFERIWVPGED